MNAEDFLNPIISFKKDPSSNSVLVSNPWSGKRLRANPLILKELFSKSFTNKEYVSSFKDQLKKMGFCGDIFSEQDKKMIDHWFSRGWHVSLEYYLWSRKGTYYDREDMDGCKRNKALSLYIQSEGGPPARVIPTGVTYILDKPQDLSDNITLGQLLFNRCSMRKFSSECVEQSVLSAILYHGLSTVRYWLCQPIQQPLQYLNSIGSGYDIYLVVYNVSSMSPGIYYYSCASHQLQLLKKGDYRKNMINNLQKMPAAGSAAWTLLFVSDVRQYQWRYRHERALRHLYFEVGKFAQKILLFGEAFNLGTLPTPATLDSHVCKLLGLDKKFQFPLYTLTMGLKQEKGGEKNGKGENK